MFGQFTIELFDIERQNRAYEFFPFFRLAAAMASFLTSMTLAICLNQYQYQSRPSYVPSFAPRMHAVFRNLHGPHLTGKGPWKIGIIVDAHTLRPIITPVDFTPER